jgi:phospho-N-acetylmuramoyl-pentapeptide-transferase
VFYEWIYPLHEVPGLSYLNLFKYITVRSAMAAVLALGISFLLGPLMIEWLRRVKLGQKVREEGPQTHYVKAGTPTMGGLLMLAAIAIPVLLCGNFHNKQVWLALGTTVWLGALGFLDDWLRGEG